MLLEDPIKCQQLLWPHVNFYDKQVEVIRSICDSDMTVCPAGNMLGKDFIAGFIAVWFFLSRSPCRIVTTSAKDDHLRVLWGEIGRFIQSSKYPLDIKKGGPFIINHQEIKKVNQHTGVKCDLSYIKGMVAGPDSIASMQGHHIAKTGDDIPRTLFISDESSSVPDEYWTMASTWANRALILGNTWPCTNFFYRAVKGTPGTDDKGGDRYSEDGERCYRRVIQIRGWDSPNVRLAEAEKELGKKPSNRIIIPGVKPYDEYLKNLSEWDPIQQCVSLGADFYEGAEIKLYPKEWLDRAEEVAKKLKGRARSGKRYMGIDTGEGGDDTVWTVIDELGILYAYSVKTPDTSIIPTKTLQLMAEYNVKAVDVLFDLGGGGKEHVDFMRKNGYKVRGVAFGGSATDPFKKRRAKATAERTEAEEIRVTYKNRRAEMYGVTSIMLNPAYSEAGFGIPMKYKELRRQLAPIPKTYDGDGKLFLLPKDSKTPGAETLKKLIGCSPDEADSFCLAVFAMTRSKNVYKLNFAA